MRACSSPTPLLADGPRHFRPRLLPERPAPHRQGPAGLPLTVAADVATFLAAPLGASVGGARWLVCCPQPSLMLLAAWGAVSRSDAEEIMSTFPADRAIGPHAYVIDASRMSATPDPEAFGAVLESLAPQWELYRGHVTRCAVILPPGMAAAVVRGFFALAPPPFETRFYADPFLALEWAGVEAAGSLLARVGRLRETVSGTPLPLLRLRALLERDPRVSVGTLARELGLSTRSLQRHLEQARTSFRQELNAARLRKARELLAGKTLKITAIALEVGCASSQHLSALFRRLSGETPSAWRARHCVE